MFTPRELHSAYIDCRRRKRGTINALRFEMNLAENMVSLEEELNACAYKPTRSVCFVNLKPKPREIFAADFRDRVVHHLFIREIEKHWEKVFIHDSFACRPGKGTHAAVDRLERFIKSISRGGRRRAWFLQIDIHNFFMSIDKQILSKLVDHGLRKQFDIPPERLPLFCEAYRRYEALAQLARLLIGHDSTECYSRKSSSARWSAIEPEKSLFGCEAGKGLPIGNLTSQFFANIYMNEFDQFVKHELKSRYYIRYVDDAVLLHEDKAVLEHWLCKIEAYLSANLGLKLNRKATRLKPISNGINFLGYIVHPDHRLTRRRVAWNFKEKLAGFRKLCVGEEHGSIQSASPITRHELNGNEIDEKSHPLIPSSAKRVSRDPSIQFASQITQGERYIQSSILKNCTVIRFDPDILERLLAVLNSYLAHMAKASSHNLLTEILGGHPWLSEYFKIENNKAMRRWKPPRDFNYLSTQYRWFRKNWPDDVILFQIGKYVELFSRDARFACGAFGLARLKARFGRVLRAGVPRGMTDSLVLRIMESGGNVLIVRETGYPLYRLKERLPFLRLVRAEDVGFSANFAYRSVAFDTRIFGPHSG